MPMLPPRLRPPRRPAPLPDAVAVRRLVVPDPAPPYDDEAGLNKDLHTGNEVISATAAAGSAADPGGQERPDDADRTRPAHSGDQDPPAGQDPGQRSDPGQPSDRGQPPDRRQPPDRGEPGGQRGSGERGPGAGGGWPSQFAQVLAETLAGSRPARQLTPWTTEQTRRRIRQLGPMLATDQRPKLRRVMTSAPAAGVLEMTAVVGFGPRVRVLAVRLEREGPRPYRQRGTRWCCTAIESA
jgi:Family of unknown function (DUF6459)